MDAEEFSQVLTRASYRVRVGLYVYICIHIELGYMYPPTPPYPPLSITRARVRVGLYVSILQGLGLELGYMNPCPDYHLLLELVITCIPLASNLTYQWPMNAPP